MYTVEVPMYSAPLEHLKMLHGRNDLRVILYGSPPDSPFNGGRSNHLLDGAAGITGALTSSFFGFSREKLAQAKATFYATLEEANKNGMQFFVVATNYFVETHELDEANTEIFRRLSDSGECYGVRNAVILVSPVLEAYLRENFGSRLMYVASCTKYNEKERILPWNVTLARYLEDLDRYDRVVLTAADSVSGRVMREVCAKNAEKVTALADILCDRTCNAYHHYEMISRYNKTPLHKLNVFTLLPMGAEFAGLNCPVTAGRSRLPSLALRVPRQRDAGVRHFKIGRNFSGGMTSSIDALVAALSALATPEDEDETAGAPAP